MFTFIKKLHPESKISLKDIQLIESQINITFPEGLINYYLEFNAANIYLSEFIKMDTKEAFEVHAIYPIAMVKELVEDDRIDGFIPTELIPFAKTRGGDRYYFDNATKKVYFVESDDADNPVFVCDSVEEFFSGLVER